MTRAKSSTIPDAHVLKVLAQEYQQMLVEAQRGIKKLLSLDPQGEEFWDQLSELDPTITLIESRSNSIHQEIDDLIDQLPEDRSQPQFQSLRLTKFTVFGQPKARRTALKLSRLSFPP